MRERWIKECCNFSGEDFNKRYNLIAQENSAHNIMSSKNIDFDLGDKLFSVEEVQEKISKIEDCINSEPERSENLEVLSDYYRIYMLALDRAYENEKKIGEVLGEKNTYLYTFDRSELETLGYKLERELGAGCENYGYGKCFIISDKKLHEYTPISINSDKGMEEYLNLRYIKSQIDFNVRNGVVYTNKPGLLIGKNGENIKKICSILGKNFIKVKELYKSEDEIIQELDGRFSKNEKGRIFITALKNNQMKVLAALAKNPITQIRAGDEYSYEGYTGNFIAYFLWASGYEIPEKLINQKWNKNFKKEFEKQFGVFSGLQYGETSFSKDEISFILKKICVI